MFGNETSDQMQPFTSGASVLLSWTLTGHRLTLEAGAHNNKAKPGFICGS